MTLAPDLELFGRSDARDGARTSLWWRGVPRYGEHVAGFIGHYAADDQASGEAILRLACRTLAKQGCTFAVGPVDGSTWHRYRLITTRGSDPLFFLEPDNPDSWPQHFEGAGFAALARYYSSVNDDNERGIDDEVASVRRCEQAGYRLRCLHASDIGSELERLWQLSCDCFRDNVFYSDISKAEFLAIYTALVERVPAELVRIAEWQGVPVAFCLALPDILRAESGAIDTVIIKSLGVLPAHRRQGLGAALVAQANASARAMGMRRTIHALMHEANPSRQIARGLMRDFRGYTLYGRPL